MIQVKMKELNACEKVLTVEVPPEDVKKEYDEFYEQIAKVAKVPGFRPGKASREALIIHFQRKAEAEVLKTLVSRSLGEAFRSKSVYPLGNPTVQNIQFSKELRYEAYIETKPKLIKLGQYKGLKAKKNAAAVNEEDVTHILKEVQESRARLLPIDDRCAEMGDAVICDYICQIDGREVERRTGDTILIKEKDFLDGFSKQLLGVKAGDQRDITIKFPDDFARKSQSGKEGIFQVSVKEIKMRKLPEIDDELAKETGDFESLEKMKDKIREDLKARKVQEYEVEFETALIDILLGNSKFDLPKQMVERRLDSLVERGIQLFRYQGIKDSDTPARKNELREKLRTQAERDIRLWFILNEIAKKEKIEPDKADFDAKYQELAAHYQRSVQDIQADYEHDGDRKDQLADKIVNEKVLQLIKDQAIIKTA